MYGLPFPLAMDEDRFIDGWAELIEGIHCRGAKIALQLIHLGRQDLPHLRQPGAPSAVRLKNKGPAPRELTIDEIETLVEKFAQSIRRAREAGFDAVQLHGGHGFLISNFLSPYFNVRQDQYGGSTENRARFVVNIITRARRLAGTDFPVLIKMNFNDFIQVGLEKDEAVEIAKILAQSGIDAIEVTGGTSSDDPLRESAEGIADENDEAYFKSYARALKQHDSIPVILVGGIRSPMVINRLLGDGTADFIAMSRPFICEPGLVRRWKDGDAGKARCISCNRCKGNASKAPLRCYLDEPDKRGYPI